MFIAPLQIAPNGQTGVEVAARSSGRSLNQGEQIFFTATLGTIAPVVPVDRLGVASTFYVSDGRLGTATITATSADGSASASGTVTIVGP